MAGALAVVYYSQQVDRLESETAAARRDLERAVEDVDRARQDALDEIAEEVEAVRGLTNRQPPVEDPTTLGLVVVRALVNSPPPPAPNDEPDGPAPAGTDAPNGALAAQESPPPPESPPPTAPPDETAPTSPPAPPAEIIPRVGNGFVVAVEGGDAFVATSYHLVADPGARAGVVEAVEVTAHDGATVAGVVHSWDESRGLALVRVPLGPRAVADWRPRTELLPRGSRITVIGLTPQREVVQVDATVGLAGPNAVVAPLPEIEFLSGAPLLDSSGRVAAVYTPDYNPFGAAAGSGQAYAPVGLFCDEMLRGCDQLEAEATATPTEED